MSIVLVVCSVICPGHSSIPTTAPHLSTPSPQSPPSVWENYSGQGVSGEGRTSAAAYCQRSGGLPAQTPLACAAPGLPPRWRFAIAGAACLREPRFASAAAVCLCGGGLPLRRPVCQHGGGLPARGRFASAAPPLPARRRSVSTEPVCQSGGLLPLRGRFAAAAPVCAGRMAISSPFQLPAMMGDPTLSNQYTGSR